MKKFVLIILIVVCHNYANGQVGTSPKDQYQIYIEKDTVNEAARPTQFKFIVYDDNKREYPWYEVVINGVRLKNIQKVTPFIVKVSSKETYAIKFVAMQFQTVVLPKIAVHAGKTTVVIINLKNDETPIKD